MIYNPYRTVKLVGTWTNRIANIELPVDQVRAMLPCGMELAPQTLTKPGNHLVRVYNSSPLIASMTFPPGMPTMNYSEHVLGVPFVRRSGTMNKGAESEYFYYMPRLWLDSLMPAAGGLMFWGMEKRLANIKTTVEDKRGSYVVSSLENKNDPITGINWDVEGKYQAAEKSAHLAAQREMMDQRLIMQAFASIGPPLVAASFTMTWGEAQFRPLKTTVSFNKPYVPGLPVGSFESPGLSSKNTLGSFELKCPWELTLPSSLDLSDFLPLMKGYFGIDPTSITRGL